MIIEIEKNKINGKHGWREWWIVKYVLSELPVLDGICKCEKRKDIWFYSSRSVITLIVSTIIMMANLFHIQVNDPMILKALKMAAGMSVGMASGAAFHNIMNLLHQWRQ